MILIADDDQPHVARYRLLAHDQAGDHVVDLDFHLVDARFIADHLVGVILVLLHQRQNAALDRVRDQRTHLLQRVVQ